MHRYLCLLLLSPLLLFGVFKEGDYFAPNRFMDQFDKNVTISKEYKQVIVVFNKAGYYDVNKFLATKSKNFLQKNHIAYLNDISQMPKSILNYFVKPRMRQKSYTILLLKDTNLSKRLNYQDEKITIYTLNHQLIHKIDCINSDELEKYLSN
jgi:hypothetical protein